MDLIAIIGERWLAAVVWLAVFAAAFAVLARRFPCNPGMHWWKDLRAARTDLLYWFLVPLLTLAGRAVMVLVAAAVIFGGPPQPTAVSGWPFWLQVVAVLLIQDALLYWLHRGFHTRLAWPFHAAHHSPKVLDWTALARFHPVNQILEFAVADVAVILLGFPPVVFVAVAPFNLVYSAMVHANLNWTFGPLRYVFASPVFHRWHHTTDAEGLDKNFASTFPFLDLLFGTFHMPAGKRPEVYGVSEPGVPAGFWGQFVQPFRGTLPVRWVRQRPGAALGGLMLGVAGALVGWAEVAARFAVPAPQELTEEEPPRARPTSTAMRPAPAVAISGDGRFVARGDADGTVRVREITTGREELLPGSHEKRVTGIAVSADGLRVASGGADGMLRVWVRGGPAARPATTHPGGVTAVAQTADGTIVVTGGADGRVRVWNSAGIADHTLACPGAVTGVAASADGRRVAAGFRNLAMVWNLTAGHEVVLRGHTDLVAAVALSADGTRAVTGGFDGLVKVWDVTTGAEQLTLDGHRGPVHGVAVSADGKFVVSGGADGTVRAWDAEVGSSSTPKATTFGGHAGGVTAVVVSANGAVAVSAGRDGTVRAWDVRDGGQKAAWEPAGR